MADFLVNDTQLESRIRDVLSSENYRDTTSCYDASRKLSKQLPQYGYPVTTVKFGMVMYQLDFLINLCDDLEERDALREVLDLNKTRFSYLELDHSWCETLDDGIRIDYIPKIRLPEGVFNFDFLLLTNMAEEDKRAMYFPIGEEFSICNLSFVCIPLCGPKFGPFQFPKITRLR
jgi:hypothetical protein